MKMKTGISCMLLTVILWTRLHLLVAQNTNSIWGVCGINEYVNSDFLHIRNQVFLSLEENASTRGFNTSVQGQYSNTTVYGFVQCRGDLNSSFCKVLASTAIENLIENCQNTSGFIQVEGCFLRYDIHNFYNDYNARSGLNQISCNPDAVQSGYNPAEALSEIINKTLKSPTLFATEIFHTGNPNLKIYTLAQCWYVSTTNCRSCLAASLSNILRVCESGALGAHYLTTNCFLRYENYTFFNKSIIPSPPQPPLRPEGKRSNVIGITLGVVAATLGLIAAIGLWKCRRKPRERIHGTRGEGGEIKLSRTIANPELIFKYSILREAASNFSEENKLGEGGFGSVFKGVLLDAREVAIKRLYLIDSRQGDTEFLNEANLISRVQHRNLVKLLGCSVKSSERLLVYEYLHNSSLDKILFDTTKRHLLTWRDRYEIIVGTARGLAYLHEESEIRIIHRDIKASNILLDNKYRPKIADFGLAKLFGEDQSHITTRVAGTFGYMAPEYALHGQLTEKADVFSFGVLVLEIISGRKNQSLPQHMEFLLKAAWRLYNEERTLEVMDPTLEGQYTCEEAIRVIKIGLLCTQAAATLRPSMSRVVSMLTSEGEHLSSPTKPAFIELDSVATSSGTPSDIHSVAVDSSSSTLEPRY